MNFELSLSYMKDYFPFKHFLFELQVFFVLAALFIGCANESDNPSSPDAGIDSSMTDGPSDASEFDVFTDVKKTDDVSYSDAGEDLSPSDIPEDSHTTDTPPPEDYPLISSFLANPSNRFLLNASGYEKISRAAPFCGADSSCWHQGAHLHFTPNGAPYTVPVFAPVNGTITTVNYCFQGGNDKYDINLTFARFNGALVTLALSLEPMDGPLCYNGSTGSDNGFFRQFILVTLGQKVQKGDMLGYMYKTTEPGDGAHIHFHLSIPNSDGFHCPNIFDSTVTEEFGAHYFTYHCNGSPFPFATFCYLPGSNEDIVTNLQ